MPIRQIFIDGIPETVSFAALIAHVIWLFYVLRKILVRQQ